MPRPRHQWEFVLNRCEGIIQGLIVRRVNRFLPAVCRPPGRRLAPNTVDRMSGAISSAYGSNVLAGHPRRSHPTTESPSSSKSLRQHVLQTPSAAKTHTDRQLPVRTLRNSSLFLLSSVISTDLTPPMGTSTLRGPVRDSRARRRGRDKKRSKSSNCFG